MKASDVMSTDYRSSMGGEDLPIDPTPDGLVDWVFSDPEQPDLPFIGESDNIPHPKANSYPEIKQYSSILINTQRELAFLDDVPLNDPYPTERVGYDKSRLLMELLNTYAIGNGWSCNPVRGNTTVNFEVLYRGGVEGIPDEYKLNTAVSHIVVVKLMSRSGPVVYSLAVG